MKDAEDRRGNPLPVAGERQAHVYAHHTGVFDAAPPEHAKRRAELEQAATAPTALERARQRARAQEANASSDSPEGSP